MAWGSPKKGDQQSPGVLVYFWSDAEDAGGTPGWGCIT